MKYELRENQGIPAPLLALMAVATGLSVANCYYNQPLLGSMAKEFAVTDFSASMVATLTQIGYVVGFLVRLACHSPCSEHLLGVGRIPGCWRIFGNAAVLHPAGVLPFHAFTQGAQCGNHTILPARRHSRFTCLQRPAGRRMGMAFCLSCG